jgi:hypothetical protein
VEAERQDPVHGPTLLRGLGPEPRAVRRGPGGRTLPVDVDGGVPPRGRRRCPSAEGSVAAATNDVGMKNQPETTRSQLALLAALARNRGELDATTLERLLRLVGTVKPAS